MADGNAPAEIVTERMRLRRWRRADRAPFAALNADPRVMEYFPSVLTREESDRSADRVDAHFERHGFGLWAVEIPGVTSFAGFTGLAVPAFDAPFMPCVEIGWRLALPFWGCGYATEAARAVVAYGFEALGLEEIVSFTVPGNVRSRRVMEKLGMTHDPRDDFDRPANPEAFRRHVLYRLRPARAGRPSGATR
jgi:RimJ/RimL family protein N-acetyltransferase